MLIINAPHDFANDEITLFELLVIEGIFISICTCTSTIWFIWIGSSERRNESNRATPFEKGCQAAAPEKGIDIRKGWALNRPRLISYLGRADPSRVNTCSPYPPRLTIHHKTIWWNLTIDTPICGSIIFVAGPTGLWQVHCYLLCCNWRTKRHYQEHNQTR